MKKQVAHNALLLTFVIIVMVAVSGKLMFEWFGITLPAFRITGGILIFFIGVHMLQGSPSNGSKVFRSPGSVRLTRLVGLIAVVVWIAGTVALAQAPAPETPRTEAPAGPETGTQAAQAIPLEKVPDRAEATRAELDALLPTREASRQTLECIGAELDRTLPEVESRLAKIREALAARPNVRIPQVRESLRALTKLTIIAGGLGVGIGFGLQNVVNNFVSGLILLFERPIEVGDTVQLSDVWGDLKRIGIRASVIRTFDGADVIVPNGVLISDKVTNWTLSDKRRRLEVDVGVEYGTPAQRVIDLLVGVAKANPKVIPAPEPRAYFVNCGDSALEFKLRVWIESGDSTRVDWEEDSDSTRSELAVAVQEALEHAGIGVPFPQRDLHLVSVSPNAASDLGTATRPSPRPSPTSDSGDGS